MRIPILFFFIGLLLSCNHKKEKSTDSATETKTYPMVMDSAAAAPVETADQPAPAEATGVPDKVVEAIRDEYNRINKASLTKKRQNITCEADGNITYYYENNKIVKVAIDWGLTDDHSDASEYYYKDGQLILVYNVSVGGPANGPEEKNEERSYVNEDRVIKFMKNQQTAPCISCQFSASSREYKILDGYGNKELAKMICE